MPEPHYGSQTKARKAALDVCYAADMRGIGMVEMMSELRSLGEQTVRELTTTLVHGVATHTDELDARIAALLPEGWTLERMPALDRSLARIAVFELDHTDTPGPTVVSEAVKLAGDLSTDDSARLLNGLLGKALETRKAR